MASLLSAAVMLHAIHVMRPRFLRRVVVLAAMVMRTVVAMSRRVHVALTHVDAGGAGPVFVGEVHAIVRHVTSVVLAAGTVGLIERHHAEIAAHWGAALSHAMALAGRAAFSADLVAGSVAC